MERLILCGGGHVSLEVAYMACHLEFEVIVIDDRPEFANAERFPMASRVMCMPFLEALDELGSHPDDFYVILTRGHAYDNVCLEKILRRDYAYVGMIGSRVKVALSMKKMKEAGFPANVLAGVHTPVGLQIGAQTPAEIAVSILGEVIQERARKGPGVPPPPSEAGVLCTITRKSGSAPRDKGAWMLVRPERLLCGHHRRRRGGVSGQAGRPGDDEAGRGAGPQALRSLPCGGRAGHGLRRKDRSGL